MNIIKNARVFSRIFYYLFYYYYLTIVTINVAIEIIVPTNENAGGKVQDERAFDAFGVT